MATSSKRTYATCCASQVGCSQSPVPGVSHCWLMLPQETLKHSKAGLDQCCPFKNLSLRVDFKLLLDGMLSDLWIAQWNQLDFKNLLGWILLCNSMCLFLVWFFFLPVVPTLLSLILIPSISLTHADHLGLKYPIQCFDRNHSISQEPLDESERGEWKSWLKTQHSKN